MDPDRVDSGGVGPGWGDGRPWWRPGPGSAGPGSDGPPGPVPVPVIERGVSTLAVAISTGPEIEGAGRDDGTTTSSRATDGFTAGG
ncbi:hypothetical protein CcI156_12450 [Frankia sp. CcI156]|uniref:hypothetical protein n=1 Tax=Frankia TaxID=1854 RepID=UPI0003D04E9B|nr:MULTISPECIES: hypothetical protein [Frankia]KFB05456.1 hypothetical protein ALLO2DRAFT_01696 [Frankia sp. Allo2]ETA01940.1 hypothetical protein CcI6DRAFT_02625 [Frankia sp. CcI6]EYT92614.1 hypothetical protein ThrDRAFT_01733 [Frankia casuarinae]KDA43383.1 hypothetical protein BMG523Draft_01700 [Frankia sp. BMG5.23]OAA24631.1 hypothetical protein AAY23_104546 [Frankia casuarinae]